MDNDTVTVTLTPDEALVLFEWVHRHEDVRIVLVVPGIVPRPDP